MRINRKVISALSVTVLSASLFAASVTSSSTTKTGDTSLSAATYTSTDNVKKAQVAMATNEYIVTAGDIYTLAFANGSYSISVDSTYRVRIANLGIINAKGLTLQEFKNKVESLIINNYPTGGVQFFLTNPAQFHVYIKGEVVQAKTVETWALVHASELLEEFYTDYSSKRLFTVISAEGEEKEYDLFKASRNGDFSQDPYLRPGDTIIVKKLDRLVKIEGAVHREGEYELLPTEELHSLIFDYAEGFSPFADKDSIQLERFTGNADVYESTLLKETDLHSDTPLACYDRVFISSIENKRSVFYVEGAVNQYYDYKTKTLTTDDETLTNQVASEPGTVTAEPTTISRLKFPLAKGQSCIQLAVENAKMFINSSDLQNAYVWRHGETPAEDQKFPINLSEVLYPTKKGIVVDDVIMEPDDILVIPYTTYYVNVIGGVYSGGKYAYQPGKDWKYYVAQANGFNPNVNLFKIITITDKNGKKLSKRSVIPPEATIYASQNSPAGGWWVPLLTSILSLITTSLSFYITIKNFKF